jgi:hypothetical protein
MLFKASLLIEGSLSKEEAENFIYEKLRNSLIEEKKGDLNLIELEEIV